MSTLSELIHEAQAVTVEVRSNFGPLDSTQLNWKPTAEAWSIAQCIQHVMLTNEQLFQIFEQVLRGQRRQTWLERLPILPSIFGPLIIDAVSPQATRKVKAIPKLQPSASSIDAGIIDKFVAHQDRLVELLGQLKPIDLKRIIVTSPVVSFVTYNLLHACTIMVRHEQRHLLQAKRVAALLDQTSAHRAAR